MQRRYYWWVIAAATFAMIFVSLGLCNSSHGLYQIPVTTSLDMTRAQFSSISTFRYVTAMILNFSFGMLTRRFGLRRLAVVGLTAYAVATLLFSFGDGPVWFYMGGIMMGFGSALGGNTVASALIANWFVKHKGTVLGIVMCASGIGGTLFSQVVTRWITQHGWRFSYRITAAITLCCAVLVAVFVRSKPEEKGLLPLGAEEITVEKKKKGTDGVLLRDAMKKPLFYIIMVCAFFIGFLNNPIYVSVPAQMTDAGFSAEAAATTSSILFFSIAVSKILLGILNDRIGLTPTIVIGFVSNIIGLALLIVAHSQWQYFLFAVVFGMSIPLETLMLSLIVGKLFGQRDYASFVGIALALIAAGIAVGNPMMGWCSDLFGSYRYALLACLITSVIVFIVLLFAVNRKRSD